jgi:hypothetical protein
MLLKMTVEEKQKRIFVYVFFKEIFFHLLTGCILTSLIGDFCNSQGGGKHEKARCSHQYDYEYHCFDAYFSLQCSAPLLSLTPV